MISDIYANYDGDFMDPEVEVCGAPEDFLDLGLGLAGGCCPCRMELRVCESIYYKNRICFFLVEIDDSLNGIGMRVDGESLVIFGSSDAVRSFGRSLSGWFGERGASAGHLHFHFDGADQVCLNTGGNLIFSPVHSV